jgi:hypothetical protein
LVEFAKKRERRKKKRRRFGEFGQISFEFLKVQSFDPRVVVKVSIVFSNR